MKRFGKIFIPTVIAVAAIVAVAGVVIVHRIGQLGLDSFDDYCSDDYC